MSETKVAPYGAWKSPITTDLIVNKTIWFGRVIPDGEDIYWAETRPAEGGRYVVVRCSADGETTDLIPPPFSARTRVHEYGGAAWAVSQGVLYFSNFADQRLYRLAAGQEPQPITSVANLRYADGVIDTRRNRMICVREDHREGGHEPVNTIVSLNLENGEDQIVLASGYDFYSSPRLSEDETRLCWLAWNHPSMPWDGTELWVAEVQPDGSIGQPRQVAGGKDESIFQPEWSPEGTLHFVSDRTGWWNLYREGTEGQIESLYPYEAEFGKPQWSFGMATYTFTGANELICIYYQDGSWHLASLNTRSGKLEVIKNLYTEIEGLQAGPGYIAFVGGSPTEATAIVRMDVATRKFEVLKRSSDLKLDPGYLSVPQEVEFPTEHGLKAHALYYEPKNKDYAASEGERPPLLLKSHGGPTSATSSSLNLEIQYWTSRGIAVLDVNYGGSTGYGRAYRQRLNGQWGLVDVDDCVNGARYLVEQGLVDGNRLAIDGGSAGGYTTLCALTFKDTFKVGASHFGVSDLETLARDSHKFESRYLDTLVGLYPEQKEVYRQRSPIHFTDRLAVPLILLQGLEDQVVPPSQAVTMFEAVKAKGLPVAYLPFEGEQHGFRRAENIKRALEAEFYFYARVFGFEPADQIEPVSIENL
jgi:dipeptidyl aminopeptidase/acylaminoacyl peptidase